MSSNNFLKRSLSVTDREAKNRSGIMPVKLADIMTYGRDPSLFDETYITERDKEASLRLRQSDIELGIERNNRAVVLSSLERRVVAAISWILSSDLDAEDIQAKITNPAAEVLRAFKVGDISKILFNDRKDKNKKKIINALWNLHRTVQVQPITENELILRQPLINIVGQVDDTSKGKQNDTDIFLLRLGTAFFWEITTKYINLTPDVFIEWRKKGRQSQLYAVLLLTLLRIYHNFINAADRAEAAARVTAEKQKLSDAETESIVADKRREALSFETNVSYLLNKVDTDYNDRRTKGRFWTDLNNAVEGLCNLGILDRQQPYDKVKGAKGQVKLIFHLSENYRTKPRLLEHKKRRRLKP